MPANLEQAVEKAQKGDLEAFGRLVERFQDAVYGIAFALVGNAHDAPDVAQDTFVQAWWDLRALRKPARFPAWLCRIARNRSRDLLRRRKDNPISLDDVPEPALAGENAGPEAQIVQVELRRTVLAAICQLSEPLRLATTLFYINGYSVQEVGNFLGVPVGTVKCRLHSSRKKLKERMMEMVATEVAACKPGPAFAARIRKVIALRKAGNDPSAHQAYDTMLCSLRTLQEEGKFEQVVRAHEDIVKAVKADKTYGGEMWWDGYRELAQSYLQAREPLRLARGLLDRLPKKPPKEKAGAFAAHLLEAAKAFLAAGRLKEAEQQIKRVMETADSLHGNPESGWCRIQGLMELRRIAERRRKRQQADELLDAIYECLADFEKGLAAACPGIQSMAQARNDVQREWFRRVGDACHNLAVECVRQGWRGKEEALRLMRRAVELRDFPPSNIILAGLLLSVEGDRKTALSHLRTATGHPEWRGLLQKEFQGSTEFEAVRDDPEFLAVVSG